MVLEICVDSVESARAAQAGGAQRLELCSDLLEGGITPSLGLIEQVRAVTGSALFVMVRPRGGDFCYTANEFRVMKRDIAFARSSGADGVVLGLLLANGTIDSDRTRELVESARPMQVTFHRAIDMSPRLEESLERVIETGADRILTSGGMRTAIEGANRIAEIVRAAGQRIAVMVCGAVREGNLMEVAMMTSATEFHASLKRRTASPVTFRPEQLSLSPSGTDEYARYVVYAEDVRAMRKVLDSLQ